MWEEAEYKKKNTICDVTPSAEEDQKKKGIFF
jgi:hypothetical protein